MSNNEGDWFFFISAVVIIGAIVIGAVLAVGGSEPVGVSL
jgi:hypothetical protein